jgi:hypothetical protein
MTNSFVEREPSMPITLRHASVRVCLLAFLVLPVAATATPDAPTVTVSASQVKQLKFKWNYVPRANYYELWFKANAGASEVKFGDLPSWHPYATNNISAHLLDWDGARYRVKACNPGGCTATAPISVKSVLPSTLGFLKSTFTKDHSGFGNVTALSEDGQTLIVAATDERYDPFYQYPVAYLYVYRRVDGKWLPDARILPDWSDPYDGSGLVLSIDAAGDRFVLGIPNTGGFAAPQGAVTVYHRTASGWVPELQAHGTNETDGIGYGVGIDGAGDTVAAGGGYGDGTTFVYRRNGTAWALTNTIGFAGSGAGCERLALSSDASTLLRNCSSGGVDAFVAPGFTQRTHVAIDLPPGGYEFGALAVDATGYTFAISVVKAGDTRQSSPQVAIYQRTTSSYTRQATVTPPGWVDTQRGTEFGRSLAISGDGSFVAIGDGADTAQGQGAFKTALTPGDQALGAVYVFQKSGSLWRLRNELKPNYTPGANDGLVSGFGRSVAFGLNGKTLIVGHPGESSYLANPDDDQENPTGSESGAVWLY